MNNNTVVGGDGDWQTGARAALIGAIGYFVLAAETIRLSRDGRNHASVWPADALILALLLNAPKRHWPTILLAGWVGNLIANTVTRGWLPGLILYGGINMAQTLLAAVLIARKEQNGRLLQNPRTVVHFLVFAGVLAPGLGATAGSLASLINYGEPFGDSFIRWFTSNALGLLVFSPFLTAVLDGSYLRCFQSSTPWRRTESVTLICGHLLLTWAVFFSSAFPLYFVPFTSLMLLTFRMGRLGAKAGVMIVALVGALAAMHGAHPMGVGYSPLFNAIIFQVYLGVMLCTTMPISATIASRADALRLLDERDQALRQIMSESPDTILGFDETGTCNWASGSLESQLGASSAQVVGQSIDAIAELICADLAGFVSLDPASAGEVVTCEFSPLRYPGKTCEASLGVLRKNGQRTGAVVTIRDVSKRKSHEQAISKLAETDDLTGVLNRKGFRTRVEQALGPDECKPVTLALIDVDHFKNINDNFGHAVGDQVLELIASHLDRGTREADIVGRLGGDEFAILFRCDLSVAHAACERIVKSMHLMSLLDASNVRVTASLSCGLASYSAGMTGPGLFEAADAALYDAKRSGRNGVHVAV